MLAINLELLGSRETSRETLRQDGNGTTIYARAQMSEAADGTYISGTNGPESLHLHMELDSFNWLKRGILLAEQVVSRGSYMSGNFSEKALEARLMALYLHVHSLSLHKAVRDGYGYLSITMLLSTQGSLGGPKGAHNALHFFSYFRGVQFPAYYFYSNSFSLHGI